MAAAPRVEAGPPPWAVLPFFYAGAAWLVVGGVLISAARAGAFVASNEPRTLSAVHALGAGWVTTTMMGASYQLIGAVLGGRPLSYRLMPVHLLLHAVALAIFTSGFWRWNIGWAALAGSLLAAAFALYLVNAGTGLARAKRGGPLRAYLATAMAFLLCAAAAGLLWVYSLHQGWMAVTLGRVAAHAHLALLGWVGLMVMGASYQLVPMFSMARPVPTRRALAVLVVTAGALVVFAAAMTTDPPAGARLALAALLAIGPTAWAWIIVRVFLRRARRRLDIHGRATVISWGFLGLAVVAGVMAALGTPFTSDGQPARWPLAYGAAGLIGWAGTSVVANGFKIVPFIVWLHRYQRRVGHEKVPVVSDLSLPVMEYAVLAAVTAGALAVGGGALVASLNLVHVGGWLLALAGVGQLLAFAAPLRPIKSPAASGGES